MRVRRRLIGATCALLTVATCVVLVIWPSGVDATPLPTVIQHKVIGYSVQHRPITAYRLGNPASRVKAVLLGQMHGDEHAGIACALAALSYA